MTDTPDIKALSEVLRDGQQCDEDGVMCIVSRQACHQAADLLQAKIFAETIHKDEVAAMLAEARREERERCAQAIKEPISAILYDIYYKTRHPVTSHTYQTVYEAAQAAIRALPLHEDTTP